MAARAEHPTSTVSPGTDAIRARRLPWSLILKVVVSAMHGGDPQGGTRERLAYQSGLLDDLPGGLAAPRCFGVVEQEDGSFWIWLEEIVEEVDKWTPEHYGLAARHLGQFNGAYLAGKPLPSEPWLSKGWLRAFVESAAPGIAQLPSIHEHPVSGRMFPPDVVEGYLRLWEERESFLDALDKLPQTFCHLDAFRRNLFIRRDANGHQQTVAADWAFAGMGAVGGELVPLIDGSWGFGETNWTIQPYDTTGLEGYLEGLRDVGWRGDPQIVRVGYATASALRYGLGAIVGLMLFALLDENLYAQSELVFGLSIGEVADKMVEGGRLLLARADEARALLPVIS